mmetsp:Transcript_135/g.485  ORF Transcript_135/g.485 Transcript_135/m.485 type:complete len:218 (+) Transcript_135:1257-1910(+)
MPFPPRLSPRSRSLANIRSHHLLISSQLIIINPSVHRPNTCPQPSNHSKFSASLPPSGQSLRAIGPSVLSLSHFLSPYLSLSAFQFSPQIAEARMSAYFTLAPSLLPSDLLTFNSRINRTRDHLPPVQQSHACASPTILAMFSQSLCLSLMVSVPYALLPLVMLFVLSKLSICLRRPGQARLGPSTLYLVAVPPHRPTPFSSSRFSFSLISLYRRSL